MHTIEAVADEVFPAFLAFLYPERVGYSRASEGGEVALALFDYLVHIRRVLQVSAGSNWDVDRFLDYFGQGHLPALIAMAVSAHTLQSGESTAGVHGYHYHADLFQFLRAGCQYLRRNASGQNVGAVDFCCELHVAVSGFIQRLACHGDTLAGEAHGVFNALLAVLVGAVVEVRAEKLLAEVVVCVVPLNYIHSAGSAADTGGGVFALYVQYILFCKAIDYGDVLGTLNCVRISVRRAPWHPRLKTYLGSRGVHGCDGLLQARDILIVVQAGLSGHGAGPLAVHRHDAHRDKRGTAAGHCLVVADIVLGDCKVLAHIPSHRRYYDSVFENDTSYAYRLKKAVRHKHDFLYIVE